MKLEKQITQEIPEEHPEESSVDFVPARFSVRDTKEVYYGEDSPPLQEDIILQYSRATPRGELFCFKLLKIIEGLHYIFSFGQISENSYGLSFKTQEYEYATTNLSRKAQEVIAATVAAPIESIAAQKDIHIGDIQISPADASYSSQEINECMRAILASPKNTLTQEELTSLYKGYKIFDLYDELFEKNFHPVHYNKRSRAAARSRYFKNKNMFWKFLPDWDVSDGYATSDFILRPKGKTDVV